MTITELVVKEFKQLFPSILKNSRIELNVEDLIDAPNSYIIEELNHLKGMVGIDENERESLLEFIVLMDEAEFPQDYDELIDQKLSSYIQKYPGIKSFIFFKILYQVNHYLDGGLDIDTICDYYKDIFENHPELIRFDDFFQRCDFLIPILTMEDPSNELISVFKDAINKYPSKALLRFLLGHIFSMRNDIENALDWNLQFIGQVESERTFNQTNHTYKYVLDYSIEDYHISLSSIARLFYKNNEFKNALIYSEKCLKEFQKNSEDIYSFQTLFVDPLTVRMRIFMKQANVDEFTQDYQLLRSKTDDVDFDEMDIDDIKEFAKVLKM